MNYSIWENMGMKMIMEYFQEAGKEAPQSVNKVVKGPEEAKKKLDLKLEG